MVDISRTLTTVTLSGIYYLGMVLYAFFKYNTFCSRRIQIIRHTKPLILIPLCFIFALLPFFVPDYYGHQMVLSVTQTYGSEKSHIEPIYNYLMELTNYDYLLFRLIIIGFGFVLLNRIINTYSLNIDLCWILIVIFFLYPMANIMRSSFSDLICLSGILYFYQKRYLKNLIICILLFGISLIFHKSAFMIIFPFILSLKKLNKTYFKIFLISLPIIIIISKLLISSLINIYFADNSFASESDFILSKRILSYISNFISMLLFTYIIFKGKNLLSYKTLYGYIYRLFFYSYLIWICLLFGGVSHYVPARFISHFYIMVALLIVFLTLNLKNRNQLFFCVSLYVINIILTSIMTLRDCYLQIISTDILNLK